MALPLKDAFTARALGVMWDNYKASLGEPPFLGRTKFGTTIQEGLTLKFIKGQNDMPVVLKASNFDAQAELRDVGGFTDIQNEMPFYRESYMVTEKEEQDYANFMSSANENLVKNVLREIAKKPMMLIRGAQVVPERQIWSLLAPVDGIPRIPVKIGGQSYIIDYTPDNGVEYKKDHFVDITGTVADKWSSSSTATPLDDLITAKEDFREKTGNILTRFSMNTKTWKMLLKAEDTKKQVQGITAYQNGIRMKDADVVAYLAEYGIEIEVYDKLYMDENGQTQYYIPTGIVSCQSGGVKLGDFTFGKTPEMRSGSLTDGTLSIVETGVSVYTYLTNHPINTHCVVSMLGLPSYEGMDSVVVMKVDA